MRLDNDKGSVLLIAIMVLYMIITISVIYFMLNINEINNGRRYYHSAEAFWLAEAGINLYLANPSMLESRDYAHIDYGNGKINITEDNSHPNFRYINSTGNYGGVEREIQIGYPANVPDVFKDSLATSGNISVMGTTTLAVVNGQTRLSGNITASPGNSNIIMDDVQQGVNPSLTSVSYSSASDSNSQDNFVDNNRALIANYPPDQVLYLSDTQSTTLTPEQVAGKTIVYVEGNVGGGNVSINTNALVKPNQTLTVIATGKVTFNQSGQQPPNSQLNIIAWGGYNETVTAPSTYHGLIYTHGVADFNNITADSVTNGGVIADGGIVLGDILKTKIFNYSNMAANGVYPPGFETLVGGSTMGVAAQPTVWKEIPL